MSPGGGGAFTDNTEEQSITIRLPLGWTAHDASTAIRRYCSRHDSGEGNGRTGSLVPPRDETDEDDVRTAGKPKYTHRIKREVMTEGTDDVNKKNMIYDLRIHYLRYLDILDPDEINPLIFKHFGKMPVNSARFRFLRASIKDQVKSWQCIIIDGIEKWWAEHISSFPEYGGFATRSQIMGVVDKVYTPQLWYSLLPFAADIWDHQRIERGSSEDAFFFTQFSHALWYVRRASINPREFGRDHPRTNEKGLFFTFKTMMRSPLLKKYGLEVIPKLPQRPEHARNLKKRKTSIAIEDNDPDFDVVARKQDPADCAA